jgi:hypothetical protein
MNRRWYYLAAVAVFLTWAAIAYARAAGAPASKTDAPAVGSVPAEGLCTDCHDNANGGAVNDGGSITVLGVPALFRSGTTYRLTVHLASTHTFGSSNVWGFQLTSVDNATGAGTGTFTLANATETKLVSGTSSFSTRKYVDQTSSGIKTGAASPVEWQVDWTAPASASSGVAFYAAGLSSDGSGTGNSWVYTGTAASTDTVTAALPSTWGAVKRQYSK